MSKSPMVSKTPVVGIFPMVSAPPLAEQNFIPELLNTRGHVSCHTQNSSRSLITVARGGRLTIGVVPMAATRPGARHAQTAQGQKVSPGPSRGQEID